MVWGSGRLSYSLEVSRIHDQTYTGFSGLRGQFPTSLSLVPFPWSNGSFRTLLPPSGKRQDTKGHMMGENPFILTIFLVFAHAVLHQHFSHCSFYSEVLLGGWIRGQERRRNKLSIFTQDKSSASEIWVHLFGCSLPDFTNLLAENLLGIQQWAGPARLLQQIENMKVGKDTRS